MRCHEPRTAVGAKQGGDNSLAGPSRLTRHVLALALVAFVTVFSTASATFAQGGLDEVDPLADQASAAASLPGEVNRPVIDAETPPWVQPRPTRVGVPATAVDLDPAIIGPPPGQPQPTLRREGDFVIDQPGRLRLLDNGVAVFDFLVDDRVASAGTDGALRSVSPTTLPSMVLQPCQRLESMLDAAEQQGQSVVFRLTGQVHVYRGLNYLLPTELTGYNTEAPTDTAVDEAQGVQADDVERAADPLAFEDEEDASAVRVGVTDDPPSDPSALMDQLADELAEDVTDRRVGVPAGMSAPLDPDRRRPRTAVGAGPAVAPSNNAEASELRREGEVLVSRAGRLTRAADARQVMFVFESDGPTLAEPPMALLACRLRAFMEDAVSERGDAQVFDVTGRVYQFQGQNFLLPTGVKLRIDSDHLGG